MTSEYYVLNGREVVPVADMMTWAEGFGKSNRNINNTEIGDVIVSTVFLGLNHAHFGGPPMLFETMIFGGKHDQHQDRCSTYDEAEAMHERAVAMVKGEIQ